MLMDEPVTVDSVGTIDWTIAGVSCTATCTPVGLTEAEILAALPVSGARGSMIGGAGKAWTVGRRDQGAYAEVSGTGVLDCSVSPLYISPTWGGTSATAEFWLKTGGTFIGTVVNDNASASGAKFVFDGGTFVPSSATPFSKLERFYVDRGGVRIDTSKQNTTISYKLQANCEDSGGLVKVGSNTLTLSGENSYAGPTIVS